MKVVRHQREIATSNEGEAGDDTFVIDDSLGYLVNRLARAYSRELSTRLAVHNVSIAQWAVLLFLWAEDGPSQRVLSGRVAIEPATLVRTIDRMERDGLVRRVRNTDDLRLINVFLTRQGNALRDSLVPYASDVNLLATSQLTDAEHGQLISTIRKVLATLDESAPRTESEFQ